MIRSLRLPRPLPVVAAVLGLLARAGLDGCAAPVALSGELHVPPCLGSFPVVLLMHGCAGPSVVDRSDDWTPAAPCAELVRDLEANGQNAELTVCRGAHHGFDQLAGVLR